MSRVVNPYQRRFLPDHVVEGGVDVITSVRPLIQFDGDMRRWAALIQFLYGSRNHVNAVADAGAKEFLRVARTIAPRKTGKMRRAMKSYRKRRGDEVRFGVVGNTRGDGNYGKRGTGVRYTTMQHQGSPHNPPGKFMYRATDELGYRIDSAMARAHNKQVREIQRRARAFTGRLGSAERNRLLGAQSRAISRFGERDGVVELATVGSDIRTLARMPTIPDVADIL